MFPEACSGYAMRIKGRVSYGRCYNGMPMVRDIKCSFAAGLLVL